MNAPIQRKLLQPDVRLFDVDSFSGTFTKSKQAEILPFTRKKLLGHPNEGPYALGLVPDGEIDIPAIQAGFSATAFLPNVSTRFAGNTDVKYKEVLPMRNYPEGLQPICALKGKFEEKFLHMVAGASLPPVTLQSWKLIRQSKANRRIIRALGGMRRVCISLGQYYELMKWQAWGLHWAWPAQENGLFNAFIEDDRGEVLVVRGCWNMNGFDVGAFDLDDWLEGDAWQPGTTFYVPK